MPRVGSKHFSYSASGRKAAKSHAKKTGQKVHLPRKAAKKAAKRGMTGVRKRARGY
jgi:hypothetical protein